MNEEKWKTIYDVQVYVTFVLILWKNTSPPETLLILTIVKPSPLPELVARQPLKRKDICLRKD